MLLNYQWPALLRDALDPEKFPPIIVIREFFDFIKALAALIALARAARHTWRFLRRSSPSFA